MVDETVATGVPEIAAPKVPIKEMTDSERKLYNRVKQHEHRERSRKTKAVESLSYSSKLEASKSEALELLRGRIRSEHVVQVCYQLGLVAAEKHGILPTKFFWANGLTQSLVSLDKKETHGLELEHDKINPSEVIHQGDLYAIWDYSVSFREPDVTFQDFIEKRRILKSDWIELGRFMDIPFEEQPHRAWQEFLPQFMPDLRPGYSLGEMQEWFKRQKSGIYPETTRDFLLQAARGSMKTTAGRCFLACALLCAPSSRLVVIAETTRLSKSSVKAFRAMWEVGHEPTRIQYWFPEHCIEQGEGSILEFASPMRTISLPQESLVSGSFETALTGSRFDLAWIDDGISNLNTANEEMRQKGLDIYDAILKLRQPGGGSLVVTVGTPWQAPVNGGVGDLYFELMRRNDSDPDKSLAILVQPAWVLSPEVGYKFPDRLNEISEQDVVLSYPKVLTFRELMKQARANINLFRTQLLCEYVESEQDRWATTFTDDKLRAAIKYSSFFERSPLVMIVAGVDTANSRSVTADKSSCCVVAIHAHEGRNVAQVREVVSGRWRHSDLAVVLVEAFQKHHVQRVVIEKNGIPWEDLQAGIQRAAAIRGYVLPHGRADGVRRAGPAAEAFADAA